jgi:hypothetical protein
MEDIEGLKTKFMRSEDKLEVGKSVDSGKTVFDRCDSLVCVTLTTLLKGTQSRQILHSILDSLILSQNSFLGPLMSFYINFYFVGTGIFNSCNTFEKAYLIL